MSNDDSQRRRAGMGKARLAGALLIFTILLDVVGLRLVDTGHPIIGGGLCWLAIPFLIAAIVYIEAAAKLLRRG